MKKLLLVNGATILLLVPLFVFGQENTWTLKQNQSLNILDSVRKFPLTDTQRDLFFEAIYYPDSDFPAKTGAVMLVKQAILQEQLDYWLVKMPYELSKKFIKVVYKLLPLVAYGDFSGVIDLVEKFTVEQANNYLNNWLRQNQVQIGSGIGKYAFQSFKNNWQTINIPYIIVYSPVSQNKAKIIIEFYSKTAIEPPEGRGSAESNMDWLNKTSWPKDRWLMNEKKGNNDGKIEPFIVRVKGQVIKEQYNNFSWDKTAGEPTVEIDFDNPVPEIAQSDIIFNQTKAGIIESIKQKILSPVEQAIKTAQGLSQKLTEAFNKAKETAEELIKKTQTYLKQINPGAQIAMPLLKSNEQAIITASKPPALQETTLLTETNKKEEPTKEVLIKNQSRFDNIVETFDEISEQADILLAQAKVFSAQQSPVKIKSETTDVKNSEKENIKDPDAESDAPQIKEKNTPPKQEAPKQPTKTEEATSQPDLIACSLSGNPDPSQNTILINELAWMGGPNSSNDEWMELKNISSSPIVLAGWQLVNQSQQIKIIFPKTTVLAPGGFLLLERTNDNSVSNIAADLIYTGALTNFQETLYLFAQNCRLQDKATANPYWPTGDNSQKKTMERKTNLIWQTSANVGGTPKTNNSSGEIQLAGNFGESSANTNQNEQNNAENLKPSQPSPPKILITEVQIESAKGVSDEFIELYNPQEEDVSLNNWSLQKATNQGSISKKNFEASHIIPTKGYFLIVNQYATQELLALADMTHNSFSISANNTIFLVASKEEIFSGAEKAIIDKVGFGASFAPENSPALMPELGKTLSRKLAIATTSEQSTTTQTYQDTDNNFLDFEIQFPSPHAKNLAMEDLLETSSSGNQATSTEITTTEATTTETELEPKDASPPTAKAGNNQIVEINQPLNFDGSSSTDDFGIVSFKWDIDEKDGINWEEPDLISVNPMLKNGYSITGDYTATLQVADEAGNTAIDTLLITVNLPPKILISEIQTESSFSAKDEFIELYNPNNFEVDLTGFVLKKKTSSGSESNLVSSSHFSGLIPALGYFLIAPQINEDGSQNYQGPSPPALYYSGKSYSVAANNTILLFSKYKKLIDKVGLGQALDFEAAPAQNHPKNYSLGRKLFVSPDSEQSTTTQTYQDTDNNFLDFEIQIPTPGSQNKKDETPPQVDITAKPALLTNQTTAAFNFSANEDCTFEYKIDDDDWQEDYKIGRSSDFVIFNNLSEGQHIFQIKAEDIFGNIGEPTLYSWEIDTGIESPWLGFVDSNKSPIFYTNVQRVKIEIFNEKEATSWFISENSLAPALDSQDWLIARPVDFLLSSGQGIKTVYVWTKDAAGNISQLGNSASIILDTSAPEITINDKPSLLTEQTAAIFSFSANEDCIFEYKIDEQGWQQDYNTEQSFGIVIFDNLSEGQHFFQVRAADQAQNSTPEPLNYSWLIDITPPSSQVETLTALSTSSYCALQWSGADELSDIANYSIQYKDNPAGKWQDLIEATTTLGTEFKGEDKHTYYFRSQAIDTAGNKEPWPEEPDSFCAIEIPKEEIKKDETPPLAISDLKAETGHEPGEIILNWTVPEDNLASGKPQQYLIKYFSEEITEENWSLATEAANPPEPQEPNTIQTFVISNLAPKTIYYFAIKSKDGADNISEISNSAGAETLSAILEISPSVLNFSAFYDGNNPEKQSLIIENKGAPSTDWTISQSAFATQSWLLLSASTGKLAGFSSSSIEIAIDISGLKIGDYQAIITIEAGQAKNSPQAVEINLKVEEPANEPPVSVFSYLPQENLIVGDEITFDASGSYDPEENQLSFFWDFDNGFSTTTYFEIIAHSFAASGEFLVSLMVEDSKGAKSSTTTANIKMAEEPKIIISEIQTESSSNKKDEFIELYNPNETKVDISQWSIQKSYSTSATVYKKNFEQGNVIPSKGYFLIVNSSAASSLLELAAQNGMTHNSFTLAEDNTVYLVNNQEKIQTAADADITDKVGFGENVFSEENPAPNPPPDNKSIGRKWTTTTNNYQDTNNNEEDFEIQIPTPKAKNKPVPPIIEPPQIIQPQQNQTFNTTDDINTENPEIQIAIQGTSTPQILISGFNSQEELQATTTVGLNGSWLLTLSLFEGKNIFIFQAQDNEGNKSATTSLILFLDTIPPARIDNLSAANSASSSEIILEWIAPGDDGTEGTATEYIVKYSITQPSESLETWWQEASLILNPPLPLLALFPQKFTVSGFVPGKIYYFAVSSKDNADNISQMSNIAEIQIPFSNVAEGLNSNEEPTNSRRLIRDSKGILYAVYGKKIKGVSNIFLAQSLNQGGTWQEQSITQEEYEQKNPSIIVDSQDNLLLVWQGKIAGNNSWQIRFKKYARSQEKWQEIENLTSEPSHQQEPSIAVDAQDNIHLVWSGKVAGFTYSQIRYLKHTSAWQEIENLISQNFCSQGRACNQDHPVLAIDSNNNLHLVWQGQNYWSGMWAESTSYGIYYRQYNGSWQNVKQIKKASFDDNKWPSIAVDANNNLHLAWETTRANNNAQWFGPYQIWYQRYSGIWEPAAKLNETPEGSNAFQKQPSIAVDSENNIFVIWYGRETLFANYQLYLKEHNNSWQEKEILLAPQNNKYPSPLFGLYPLSVGENINIPKNGYLFLYQQDTKLKFYSAPMLQW